MKLNSSSGDGIVYLLVQIVSSALLLVTVFEKNQTSAERIKLYHINFWGQEAEVVMEGNKVVLRVAFT